MTILLHLTYSAYPDRNATFGNSLSASYYLLAIVLFGAMGYMNQHHPGQNNCSTCSLMPLLFVGGLIVNHTLLVAVIY